MDESTDNFAVRGQSLVEMAIIMPLLLIMFIGVLEVGWALRGYLVLSNANREAARFAAKQINLDFSQPNPGYEGVYSHTLATIAGQIPFTQSGGVFLMSYLHFDVPCTGTYTATMPLIWRSPETSTEATRMDYARLIPEQIAKQGAYACSLVGTPYAPQENNLIIVEMWYRQPQLLGFPLLSNSLTDPVPMYVHSVFRRYESER